MTNNRAIQIAYAWICAIVASVWLGGAAIAQIEVETTPVPAWVVPLAIPEATEADIEDASGGTYHRLYDSQVRVSGDHYVNYIHSALMVTGQAGLDDIGRLTFEFNPAQDQFRVHTLRIIRDGVVQDRLDDVEFTVIRRESDLGSSMIDGSLTAFAELFDIRIGDTLDYEVSWETRSPIWPGGFANDVGFEWSDPLGIQRFRLLTPENMPVETRWYHVELEPEISRQNGYVDRRWTRTRGALRQGDPNVPPYYVQWGFMSVSTMRDWAETTAWGIDMFNVDRRLAAETRARIASLEMDHNDIEGRITGAIRYVQDDIRYVANSVGLGSHVPRPPAQVVQQGYGDCKDKSLLLVEMLGALGIEAHVALTDIDQGRSLPLRSASPYAFDHAIVVIVYRGEEIWIDPTASNRGGIFPHMTRPDYGFGLPLRPGQDDLVAMPSHRPDRVTLEVRERFDFAEVETRGVDLTVTSTYREAEADTLRAQLANTPLRSVTSNYLNYYTSHYPGMESAGQVEANDDRDANTIIVRERYSLSTEAFTADGQNMDFTLRGDAVLNQFAETSVRERRSPLVIPYPVYRRHSITLANPPVYVLTNPPINVTEPFAIYTVNMERVGDGAELIYTLQTLSPEADAASVAANNALANEIENSAYLAINLTPDSAMVFEDFLTWMEDPANNTALIALMFLIYALIMLPGAIISLAQQKKVPGEPILHPVSMSKFAVMNILTLGAYQLLWMWKNWRWIKVDDERNISPLGRTIFGVFFVPALASEIDGNNPDDHGLPGFLLITLGVLYSIWTFGFRIADRFIPMDAPAGDPVLALTFFGGQLGFVFLLPLVGQINRLNTAADQGEALHFNSRYRFTTWLAVIIGLMMVALTYFGALMPA